MSKSRVLRARLSSQLNIMDIQMLRCAPRSVSCVAATRASEMTNLSPELKITYKAIQVSGLRRDMTPTSLVPLFKAHHACIAVLERL